MKRTLDELVKIIEEENLTTDAISTMIMGNNKYNFQAVYIPKENVEFDNHICKLNLFGEDIEFVSTKEFEDIDLLNKNNIAVYLLQCEDAYSIEILKKEPEESETDFENRQRDYLIKKYLEIRKIDTRGKLLNELADGYKIFKDYNGIDDNFTFQRDVISGSL